MLHNERAGPVVCLRVPTVTYSVLLRLPDDLKVQKARSTWIANTVLSRVMHRDDQFSAMHPRQQSTRSRESTSLSVAQVVWCTSPAS